MPITPEQRKRLHHLMNARRLDLGITWRDVATGAGLSYEVLRKLRTGTGGIRDLTASQISKALGWEPSSVERILAGGQPEIAGENPRVKRLADVVPECAFERNVLATPGVSDEAKLAMINGHRLAGHGRWCQPESSADTGTPSASLPA